MSGGPAPDGFPPFPSPMPRVTGPGRRFVCAEPGDTGREACIRTPAASAFKTPGEALWRLFLGVGAQGISWVAVAFLMMLFLPVIGIFAGALALALLPLGLIQHGYRIWRSAIIECLWCHRLVHVGADDHKAPSIGFSDILAKCQCGAGYRHATWNEFPLAERHSNVPG